MKLRRELILLHLVIYLVNLERILPFFVKKLRQNYPAEYGFEVGHPVAL